MNSLKSFLLILAVLTLSLPLIGILADNTGCAAVDSSTDVPPQVVEISISRITGKTVELVGVVNDPDSGLRMWIWDFGDGEVERKTGGWSKVGDSLYKMVVRHTYDDYRTYWVTVKVIDYWDKESRNKTVPITVSKSNYEPIVEFKEIRPNPAKPGEEITFRAVGLDPDGQVVHYYWDFGDGKKKDGSNLSVVKHSYSKAGTYIVKVRVKDDSGAYSGTVSMEVYVISESKAQPRNRRPVISSVNYVPKEPNAGETVRFRATAIDPDGDSLRFEWNFGDGTIKNGGAQITHIYKREGAYTVKVKAIDSEGAASSIFTVSVAVRGNKAPQATIVDIKNFDNRTFAFQGMGLDPDGQVISFVWDFGDGKQYTGELEGNSIPHKYINHTYSRSGNYTVKFRVKDDKGAWSLWVSKKITVLVEEKQVSSAVLGGMGFNDLGIAAIVGGLIVSAAAYLAYKESKSNTFLERSKELRKTKIRKSRKGKYVRRGYKGRSYQEPFGQNNKRKKKPPWP